MIVFISSSMHLGRSGLWPGMTPGLDSRKYHVIDWGSAQTAFSRCTWIQSHNYFWCQCCRCFLFESSISLCFVVIWVSLFVIQHLTNWTRKSKKDGCRNRRQNHSHCYKCDCLPERIYNPPSFGRQSPRLLFSCQTKPRQWSCQLTASRGIGDFEQLEWPSIVDHNYAAFRGSNVIFPPITDIWPPLSKWEKWNKLKSFREITRRCKAWIPHLKVIYLVIH